MLLFKCSETMVQWGHKRVEKLLNLHVYYWMCWLQARPREKNSLAKALVVAREKTTWYHFPRLYPYQFPRLFPGLENRFATFSRIQDSVWTLDNLLCCSRGHDLVAISFHPQGKTRFTKQIPYPRVSFPSNTCRHPKRQLTYQYSVLLWSSLKIHWLHPLDLAGLMLWFLTFKNNHNIYFLYICTLKLMEM